MDSNQGDHSERNTRQHKRNYLRRQRRKNLESYLKTLISKAKEEGNHKKAAEIRQDLWVLQDLKSGKKPKLDDESYRESMRRVSKGLKDGSQNNSGGNRNRVFYSNKEEWKVRKKLEEIKILKEKEKRGQKLEANQITKIQKEEELLQKLTTLSAP